MILLIVQIWVLALYSMAGMMKIMMPKKKFEKKMGWATEYSEPQLKWIGMAEVAGALGLTLPIWLDIVPWLSLVAAVGLAIVTLLAVILHTRRKESGSILFASFNFLLLVYVIWNYWMILGY